MPTSNRIRLGLWLVEAHASRHEHALAQWANAQPNVDLVLIHALAPTAADAPALLFAKLTALEAARLGRDSRHRAHLERFELRDLPGTQIVSDVKAVAALGLDLIVCAGTALPPDDIVESARLGVLAFDWADPVRRVGLPVGFWEVYERRDVTSFSIVRLPGGSNRREKLLRGSVPTRHYHLLNQAALCAKAHHYLRCVLTDWLATGHFPDPLPSMPGSTVARDVPSNLQSLAYLGRGASASLSKKLTRIAGHEERWKVSFLYGSWRTAELSRGRPIENPPGRYLADPFVIRRDGRDYCFVEDFDCAAERGAISVYELGAEGATRIGLVLDEPFHLSFPFLFEHDGALFMCPESSANRDIRIYKCVNFPLDWRLEKVVMVDVSAVDTMFVQHEKRWWMLTNMDPAQTGEICSELCIFWADSPFADSWTPHPKNPVVFDAAYARNGGLLRDGAKIYRVSQRQGFDRYGKGSQINQIEELTEFAYQERRIETVEPRFAPKLLGTHHLHGDDTVTVFDSLSSARASSPDTAPP